MRVVHRVRSARVLVVALLLLFSVIAAACSTSSSTIDAPIDAPIDTAAEGPAPFDAVLIELFGTTDTDSYLTSIERNAAEIVVECMTSAGFEFQIPPEATALEPPDPASLEDARTSGFGIIDGFRQQVRETDLEAQQGQDPNTTYVSTLPAAEFDRFFITLDGIEPEPGQRREGGCNGQASDEAYSEWLRFSEALPNYTAMGEERDTHPDWVAASEIWRACMTDLGFDYAEPDAIRTDVISRMRATVQEVYPSGQVPLVIVDGVPEVDPTVDVLLDELADFEIRAAVANVECTTPIADQFDAVERQVQQQFVERNQEMIDSLLRATE